MVVLYLIQPHDLNTRTWNSHTEFLQASLITSPFSLSGLGQLDSALDDGLTIVVCTFTYISFLHHTTYFGTAFEVLVQTKTSSC